MGAFENEVISWVQGLKEQIYKRERFTWINVFLSIAPSPPAGILAIILAIIQLTLCFKGKIPASEKNLLFLALILGVCNLCLTIILISFLAKEGWSFWQTFDPFFWHEYIRHKLIPRESIIV